MGFGACGGTLSHHFRRQMEQCKKKKKIRQCKLAANQQIITQQPTKNIRRRGIENVEEVRLGRSVQRGSYSIILAAIRCK